MQVTDKFNLLPPSICIICETQPDGLVIDTLYNLRTGVASAFNGRKYVCERCVGEFARLLGFERGVDVKQAKIDKEFAERVNANLRARVVEFADAVKAFAEHPGAGDEFSAAEAAVADSRKPEVEEVFASEPIQKGGTTRGIQKVADSETPSVPSPAVAESGVDTPREGADAVEAVSEPAPKKRGRPKKES